MGNKLSPNEGIFTLRTALDDVVFQMDSLFLFNVVELLKELIDKGYTLDDDVSFVNNYEKGKMPTKETKIPDDEQI